MKLVFNNKNKEAALEMTNLETKSMVKFDITHEKCPDNIRTILFVDDHKYVIRNLKPGLEMIGYNVFVGYNGIEALSLYQEKAPDIVFLDLLMPVMDGLLALIEIKKINPIAKVIMMVNFGIDDEITENIKVLGLVERGAISVLVKPANLQVMNKKIWELSIK